MKFPRLINVVEEPWKRLRKLLCLCMQTIERFPEVRLGPYFTIVCLHKEALVRHAQLEHLPVGFVSSFAYGDSVEGSTYF